VRDQLGQELEELTASLFEVGLFTLWPRVTSQLYMLVELVCEDILRRIWVASRVLVIPLSKTENKISKEM
jgi:hypothetical protein